MVHIKVRLVVAFERERVLKDENKRLIIDVKRGITFGSGGSNNIFVFYFKKNNNNKKHLTQRQYLKKKVTKVY